MSLLIVAQNTNCRSPTQAFVLVNAAWSPAVFWLRHQQQYSSDVGASQTLGGGRSGTEPTRTESAHSGRFLGAQHDRARHPPRGPRGAPRCKRHSACPMAWTGSSRIPTFANAASSSALRNGTAAVSGTKHNGASAPTKQSIFRFTPVLRHHLSVPHHVINHHTREIFHSSSSLKNFPTLFSIPAAWQHPGASALMVGRHRRTSTRTRNSTLADVPRGFGLKCTEKKRSGSAPKRRRRAACRPSLQDQRTSVQFCRGAPCCNKAVPDSAATANRSVAVQSVDPAEHEKSLWDWLTTSTTTTAATQTSALRGAKAVARHPREIVAWNSRDFSTASSEPWTRFVTRAGSCRPALRQPFLSNYEEQLRDRIQSLLDMNALNQSCGVESTTSRAPQAPPRPAICRRAPTMVPQTRTKRFCAEAKTQATETNEEI